MRADRHHHRTLPWFALGVVYVLWGSTYLAPVSTVATYAHVNPVIAVLLGVVVAGERFSVPQLAGGAIVLVAGVMVIAAERRSPPPPRTPRQPSSATAPGPGTEGVA